MHFNELVNDIYHLCTARREMGSKITSLVSEKSYDMKAAISMKHSCKSSGTHQRKSNSHQTGTVKPVLSILQSFWLA